MFNSNLIFFIKIFEYTSFSFKRKKLFLQNKNRPFIKKKNIKSKYLFIYNFSNKIISDLKNSSILNIDDYDYDIEYHHNSDYNIELIYNIYSINLYFFSQTYFNIFSLINIYSILSESVSTFKRILFSLFNYIFRYRIYSRSFLKKYFLKKKKITFKNKKFISASLNFFLNDETESEEEEDESDTDTNVDIDSYFNPENNFSSVATHYLTLENLSSNNDFFKKKLFDQQNFMNLILESLNYKFLNYNFINIYKIFDNNFLDLFSFIQSHFYDQIEIKEISVFEMSMNFSFMLWTKNANNFLDYLNKTFFILKRREQNILIWWMSSFNSISFLKNVENYNIIGFYMKFLGKIAGYGGDQSKIFCIRIGSYSRSKNQFKTNYFYKQLVNLNGTVGTKIIIAYH